VNRAERRATAVEFRRWLQSNPYWIEQLRQYPEVSLDAPEIPGRKYRTITHHHQNCRGAITGKLEEDCDCGPLLITKHLEPQS
jgi:hypothetical protein